MVASKRLICVSAELMEGGKGVRFQIDDVEAEAAPAFVVRFQGRPYAYLNRCGHTPIELDWKPGEFFDASRLYLICATHGALFDPASGSCLGGPCHGRGLRPIRVVEEDGEVFLIQEGE